MKVPEGWKLVPVEPDTNMLGAASAYIRDMLAEHFYKYRAGIAASVYEKMLAAAPPHPEAVWIDEAAPINPAAWDALTPPAEAGAPRASVAPVVSAQATPVAWQVQRIDADEGPSIWRDAGADVARDCSQEPDRWNVRALGVIAAPAHPDDAAAPQPAAQQSADGQDAARWRETLMHVGAGDFGRGQVFTMWPLPIPHDTNLMRGSTAEHFTNAIDAAIAHRDAIADGATTAGRNASTAVILTGHQLADALDMIAPDAITMDRSCEQLTDKVSIGTVQRATDDDGHVSGPHLCAWSTEYPDEACIRLDGAKPDGGA